MRAQPRVVGAGGFGEPEPPSCCVGTSLNLGQDLGEDTGIPGKVVPSGVW